MNSNLRRILALLSAGVLALALTLLLSSGGRARAMLQVSPFESPILAPTVTFAAPGGPVATPTSSFVTLEPPTSVPLPELAGATPTPKGFLPAPTIVNPEEVKSLPLAQPRVSSAGDDDKPTPVPVAPPAADAGVRAVVTFINYVWLLCGGLLLVGGAVAIVLVWRRGQRT